MRVPESTVSRALVCQQNKTRVHLDSLPPSKEVVAEVQDKLNREIQIEDKVSRSVDEVEHIIANAHHMRRVTIREEWNDGCKWQVGADQDHNDVQVNAHAKWKRQGGEQGISSECHVHVTACHDDWQYRKEPKRIHKCSVDLGRVLPHYSNDR